MIWTARHRRALVGFEIRRAAANQQAGLFNDG